MCDRLTPCYYLDGFQVEIVQKVYLGIHCEENLTLEQIIWLRNIIISIKNMISTHHFVLKYYHFYSIMSPLSPTTLLDFVLLKALSGVFLSKTNTMHQSSKKYKKNQEKSEYN